MQKAATSEKSDSQSGRNVGVENVKFYIKIPITDVGVVVLEQALTIDPREVEDTD